MVRDAPRCARPMKQPGASGCYQQSSYLVRVHLSFAYIVHDRVRSPFRGGHGRESYGWAACVHGTRPRRGHQASSSRLFYPPAAERRVSGVGRRGPAVASRHREPFRYPPVRAVHGRRERVGGSLGSGQVSGLASESPTETRTSRLSGELGGGCPQASCRSATRFAVVASLDDGARQVRVDGLRDHQRAGRPLAAGSIPAATLFGYSGGGGYVRQPSLHRRRLPPAIRRGDSPTELPPGFLLTAFQVLRCVRHHSAPEQSPSQVSNARGVPAPPRAGLTVYACSQVAGGWVVAPCGLQGLATATGTRFPLSRFPSTTGLARPRGRSVSSVESPRETG